MQNQESEHLWAKQPWKSYVTSIQIAVDFPGGSVGKESAHNVGDLDLILGL